MRPAFRVVFGTYRTGRTLASVWSTLQNEPGLPVFRMSARFTERADGRELGVAGRPTVARACCTAGQAEPPWHTFISPPFLARRTHFGRFGCGAANFRPRKTGIPGLRGLIEDRRGVLSVAALVFCTGTAGARGVSGHHFGGCGFGRRQVRNLPHGLTKRTGGRGRGWQRGVGRDYKTNPDRIRGTAGRAGRPPSP